MNLFSYGEHVPTTIGRQHQRCPTKTPPAVIFEKPKSFIPEAVRDIRNSCPGHIPVTELSLQPLGMDRRVDADPPDFTKKKQS